MNKYFDYASTTFMSDENIQLYGKLLDKYKYNSESLYPNGVNTDNALSRARRMIAEQLNVNEKEIIFTSCGSEANNMAIKGVALARRSKEKQIILFNRFADIGSKTTRKEKSVGLGLFVINELCILNNIDVEYKENENAEHGSIFTLKFLKIG